MYLLYRELQISVASTIEAACEPKAGVSDGRNLWQAYTDHRMFSVTLQEQIRKEEGSQLGKEEQE